MLRNSYGKLLIQLARIPSSISGCHGLSCSIHPLRAADIVEEVWLPELKSQSAISCVRREELNPLCRTIFPSNCLVSLLSPGLHTVVLL